MAPSSASKADIAIGRQKKKQYEPIQTLGRGATGTVKLCRHRPSGQLVALKSIAKPSSGTEEDQRVAEESFWHEVTALRRAGRHENLCGLLDAFETGSKYYLVLDYCSGGDLFKRIEQGGPFTERTAATVIVTILNALLYLHAHGVVHRDLKPANLLMRDGSDNAALVLVDFGSSFVATKAPRASGVDRKEAMKTIAGTPYYLAPEIVKGKRYTEKVDLWSVGCIAYQLLCGQTPFQNAAGFQQLYARIQKADFDFPENVPISENAKDFIKRLLVVDPEKRPTAREAMAHEWFKEHIPTCYWLLLKLFNHEADPRMFEGPTASDVTENECPVLLEGFAAVQEPPPPIPPRGSSLLIAEIPDEPPLQEQALARWEAPLVAKPLRQGWESFGRPGVLQIPHMGIPDTFYDRLVADASPVDRDELLQRHAASQINLADQSGFVWADAFSRTLVDKFLEEDPDRLAVPHEADNASWLSEETYSHAGSESPLPSAARPFERAARAMPRDNSLGSGPMSPMSDFLPEFPVPREEEGGDTIKARRTNTDPGPLPLPSVSLTVEPTPDPQAMHGSLRRPSEVKRVKNLVSNLAGFGLGT